MRRANNLRATLLYDLFKKKRCELVVSRMISEVLKNTPSYSESAVCEIKRCKHRTDRIFPLLCLNNAVFDNKLSNIGTAIVSNFPENVLCGKCEKPMKITRVFGNHLFIEVRNIILFQSVYRSHQKLNNFRFRVMTQMKKKMEIITSKLNYSN